MTVHFWVWVLYFVWLIGNGLGFRYRTAPTQTTGPIWIHDAMPWMLAILLLAICWAAAGDPAHALIRGGN
jgi:hypothetical protein